MLCREEFCKFAYIYIICLLYIGYCFVRVISGRVFPDQHAVTISSSSSLICLATLVTSVSAGQFIRCAKSHLHPTILHRVHSSSNATLSITTKHTSDIGISEEIIQNSKYCSFLGEFRYVYCLFQWFPK